MKSCRDTAEIARRIGAGQHDPAEDGAFVSAVADLCGFTRLDVDIAERFRPTGAIAEVHELGEILFPGGHISDDETALFIGPGLKIVVIIDGRVKEFLVGIGDAERVGAAGVVLTSPENRDLCPVSNTSSFAAGWWPRRKVPSIRPHGCKVICVEGFSPASGTCAKPASATTITICAFSYIGSVNVPSGPDLTMEPSCHRLNDLNSARPSER